MTITFTEEQPNAAAAAGGAPAQRVSVQQPDVFSRLTSEVSSCYGILKFIQICVSVDASTLTAKVEVKIFGDVVASGTLSAANPCLSVDVHPHAAGVGVELKVEICLDIPGKKVTVSGKACVDYIISHKCAHLDNHTIIHF